jgi:hypothetical protein
MILDNASSQVVSSAKVSKSHGLGINYAQGFDLNVHMHSIDVDDVAPPTVKLSDAKRHASLLSDFLLDETTLYILVLMTLLVLKNQ